MATISANLQAVHARMAAAARACGRDPGDISLIAVSKTISADAIADAYRHGQRAFGENYVQEALEKIAALDSPKSHVETPLGPLQSPLGALEWHFIGPIQSNKTRVIAENFDWVHSVDRAKIAERLSAARPVALAPLEICIQVNIGGEDTKSGVAPAEVLALARAVSSLPRLRLRGLMTVPPPTTDRAEQQRYFAALRHLKDTLTAAGIPLDTLSMGMSADLDAAIGEGATLVRVGTAIFGERNR